MHNEQNPKMTKYAPYIRFFIWNVIPVSAAIIAGIITYQGLNQSPPFRDYTPDTVTVLLTLDLILLLSVGGVITHHVLELWRKRGHAGNRLHSRMVMIFGIMAAIPAIVMTGFSGWFLYNGLQPWFSDRVRSALEESSSVAAAYLQEHHRAIRNDTLAMSIDLNRQSLEFLTNPSLFAQALNAQAALRGLSEAIVFYGRTKQVLARTDWTFLISFEPIYDDVLERARSGEIILATNQDNTLVRALTRLQPDDTFLFVSRRIDPAVMARIQQTEQAVANYTALTGQNSNLQIIVSLIFMSVSLLVFLAAVWSGWVFANYLSAPIRVLISAAEKVGEGDFNIRVPEKKRRSDIDILSHTFNQMTKQIASQSHALIQTNHTLELRRRYTEMILAGVSAGVVVLDRDHTITFLNDSAIRLLELETDDSPLQRPFSALSPEMNQVVAKALETPPRFVEEQIAHSSGSRTFLTRVGAIVDQDVVSGYVVTFDDITTLLFAQRKVVWSDIAQRVAHEIKNPLTPILMATERLKSHSVDEKFVAYTDIIIRHVQSIRNLVNEFSLFARMPPPSMKVVDLHVICHQAVTLTRHAHPEIAFEYSYPPSPPQVLGDEQQLLQALINLLQNALDAIDGQSGTIRLTMSATADKAMICVRDTGPGLPKNYAIDQLFEPYVTSRQSGTGLGLAIVDQIMRDHRGHVTLENHPQGGTKACMIMTVLSAEPTE